jgi:hypothetical protein
MVGFHDIVHAYFTQVTGRLVMFSGRDVALMRQWRAQGATAALLCCGIRDAVLAMEEHDDPPRSLYNCRAYIEPYIERARLRQLVGGEAVGEQEVEEAPVLVEEPEVELSEEERARHRAMSRALLKRALEVIEQLGHQAQDGASRASYRAAWHKVKALLREEPAARPQLLAELEALDESLAQRWFYGLPEHERGQIDALALGPRGLQQLERMSEDAQERWLWARRREVLRERFGLASLVDLSVIARDEIPGIIVSR